MNRLSSMAIAVTLLALGACNEYKGTVSVDQNMNIKNRRGRVVTLTPGNYPSTVGGVNGRTGRFTINAPQNRIDFDFPLPPELKDRNYVGKLSLSAAKINQAFNIDGEIAFNVNTSGPYTRTVSCVYDTYTSNECHQECYSPPSPDHSDNHGGSPGGGHGGGGDHGGGGHGGGDHGGGGHGGGDHGDHDGHGGHGGGDGDGDHDDHGGHEHNCHQVCDTVVHNVYGSQRETYETTTREHVSTFDFNDKISGQKLGEFRASQGVSTSDHVISEDSCVR